jgi:hypothetical protein
MVMAKKKQGNAKFPAIVEEISQAIEESLERFSPEERSARLDKINLILAGSAKSRRGNSSKVGEAGRVLG